MNGYLAGIFQIRRIDLLDAGASGDPQGGIELIVGNSLPVQDVAEKPAIVDQDLRTALDELFKGFALVGETTHDPVGNNEPWR